MNDLDLSSIKSFGLDLDQYFGLWAVEGERFMMLFHRVAGLDLADHVRRNMSDGAQPVAAVAENRTAGTAIQVIDIQGTMTKRGSSLSSSGSMISLKRAVRAAGKDPEVSAILLRIDSPGGTVSGTQELAAEVRRVREAKPVWALCEDLTASAAYWVASQCEKVYANTPTAVVGSIGTFVGLYDLSGAAAKEGVRAVMIKAGALKGTGFPGTEITEEQVAYWQEIVDATQAQFTSGVAAGRGRSADEVRDKWVTGRVYMAEDAVTMGLIDGIRSFEQTVEELSKRATQKKPPTRRSQTMSEENVLIEAKPLEASIGELKASCPGADAEFLMSQLEAHATVATAQTAWIAEQAKRLAASQAEAAAAKAEAEAAKTEAAKTVSKRPGAPTVPSSDLEAGSSAGSPKEAFDMAVQTLVEAGMPKVKAISRVVKTQPAIYKAMLAAANH